HQVTVVAGEHDHRAIEFARALERGEKLPDTFIDARKATELIPYDARGVASPAASRFRGFRRHALQRVPVDGRNRARQNRLALAIARFWRGRFEIIIGI